MSVYSGVTIKKRVAWLFIMWGIVSLMLAMRLFWLQIAQGDRFRKLALDQRLYPVPVDARRGTIRDRNGRELAVSVSADSIYAVPVEVKDPAGTAETLARILEQDPVAIRNKLIQKAATVWIDRRVDPEKAAAIRKLNLPGIGFTERGQRFYPKDRLAAHVLGIAGIDNQGLEGVEVQYDSFLRGTRGQIVSERDATGKEIPGGVSKFIPPVDGNDLYLSIDEVIQYIVERELDRGMAETKAKRGMILAMDPKTGAVLAMAARPTYNPNRYYEYPESARRNIVVSDAYEPGSTFKIVTAAAAMEEGVVKPSDTFFDPGFIRVEDRYVRCWLAGGHGSQTFTEATENSCNVVFATLGIRLGTERFYRYIRAFGFGSTLGIDYPGEASGLLQPEKNVGLVEIANISFGQGVSVTPLQLLSALNAIANGGTLMRPRLVSKAVAPDGSLVEEFKPEPIRQVISKETARELSLILESVVVNGSGFRARIPGYRVAGKTGTAEKPEAGRYGEKRVASFLGFAPVEDPRISVLVIWDEPNVGISYGGVLAAPTFQAIVRDALRYMEVPPRAVSADAEKPGEVAGEPQLVAVPDLVGRPAADAAKALAQDFGLQARMKGSGETVRDQTPRPGARVPRGTTVVLYLDMGDLYNGVDGNVTVPHLTGRTMKDVAILLSEVGLRLQAEGAGIAVWQDPGPGTKVPGGSVVVVRFEPPAAGEPGSPGQGPAQP
ncbi:MAG: stage V sporulation protein D [Bacillota bacterium]|nr:stage V sporulation protein D [Bacillota bacterium]